MGNRIYLYGFMGSGKSTIGKVLAQHIGYDFLDLDDMIEDKAGKTVREIFEYDGEVNFRKQETEALRETLNLDSQVISTGGGTPVSVRNSKILERAGLSFYLNVSTTKLAQRLYPEMSKRPLLKGLQSVQEISEFIEIKLSKRKRYYSKATFTVDANHSVEHIIKEIVSKLEQEKL